MAEGLLAFAWCWFGMGVLSGAVLGLGFHRPDWGGGYGSWTRRLARLGHIAFFGTGGLCLAMGLSSWAIGLERKGHAWSSAPAWLVVFGAVAMPTVCFLSAWRMPLRRLFPLPVVSLALGVGWFTVLVVRSAFADWGWA